ncbi:MAG: type II secretion system protein GspC [Gammaproteobacteria bacterium]
MAWIANLLLALWIAYKLAQLTWSLVPVPALPAPKEGKSAPATQMVQATAPRYGQIVGWHLFGRAKSVERPPDISIEAPETRLNLKLMGVLSSDEKDSARAIIADPKGDQRIYSIGAQLPGDAELMEIHPDRVILKRNQRRETLRLERLVGFRGRRESLPAATSRKAGSRRSRKLNASASALLTSYQEKLESDPGGMVRILRPVPAIKNGQFIGYRLGGGKNNKLLRNIGLAPGDIVTEVNGIKLTSMSKGLEAASKLRSADQFNITVLRKGREVNLSVVLP